MGNAWMGRRRKIAFYKTCGRCAYCGGYLRWQEKWHLDHVKPRARGGRTIDENLFAACPSCNSSKSCWGLEEWRSYISERLVKDLRGITPRLLRHLPLLPVEDSDSIRRCWLEMLQCLDATQIKFYFEQIGEGTNEI